MSKKRALILLNESAGKKKGPQGILSIIERTAREGYDPVVYPIIPGEINSEDVLGEYDEETGLVICIGGDGTLNHVVGAIMNKSYRPVVGYIPAGSTNDFSKSLGIPANLNKALDLIFTAGDYKYDVGGFNDRYFNYTAAFGAFSEVSYATDQKLKNVLGYAAYVLNGAANLYQNLSFKRHMVIDADDFHEEGEYVFGTVSNSVSIGGMSFLSNYDVKLDDGKMELLLVKAPRRFSELGNIISALMKGDVSDPHISFRQITHASFRSDEGVAWSVDGECGGTNTYTEIRVMHKAIAIRSSNKTNE